MSGKPGIFPVLPTIDIHLQLILVFYASRFLRDEHESVAKFVDFQFLNRKFQQVTFSTRRKCFSSKI